MSTQYWSDPSKQRGPSHRRTSSENDPQSLDPRYSLDGSHSRRPNRASTQTTHTDTPTESTFSPNSPIMSADTGHGLAPRPPSYARPINQDTISDFSEQHARRVYGANDDDDALASPISLDPEFSPPAAPDVPRAPPVSYRRPYGYAYPPGDTTRQAIPRSAPMMNTAGEVLRSPIEQQSPRQDTMQRAGSAQYFPDQGQHSASQQQQQPRRASATESTERRKKLAIDRSPLQRLELTLDSMTKEEKRARMQAAEQRARDRAALRNTATSDNRLAVPVAGPPPRPRQASLPAAAAVPQRQQVPYSQPNTQRRSSVRNDDQPVVKAAALKPDRTQPPTDRQQQRHIPESKSVDTAAAAAAQITNENIPKRNLSFKARAERTDGVPTEVRSSTRMLESSQQTSNAAPSRSASNRLRKDMPAHLLQYLDDDSSEEEAEEEDLNADAQPPLDVPVSTRAKVYPNLGRDKALPLAPHPNDTTSTSENNKSARINQRSGNKNKAAALLGTLPNDNNNELRPQGRDNLSGPRTIVDDTEPTVPSAGATGDVAAARRRLERQDSDYTSESSHHHRISNFLYKAPENLRPGQGLYKPPQWLDEWKKATVGLLSGPLLHVHEPPVTERKAWWEEAPRKGHNNTTNRQRKAEAFDGEYDDTNAPTRFKPQLFLKCGPLLRYCGIRREPLPTRAQRGGVVNSDREIWRGSIMIVTNDAASSYEIAPMLRLFIQDIELLGSPPHQVDGDLSPEFVDPISGHPKLGRSGETLYVRPVEHLEEGHDVSRDETDEGIYEQAPSPPDAVSANGSTELPGSFATRRKRVQMDGEKAQKYKDVRGFRLHAERGVTFWRFNIEIELRDKQQRVAYRINRGPCMGFWVPAQGETMNMMFYSCNGFSSAVNSHDFSGPDPMWRDVLNTHQTQPFHVMIGGGDQIYNDCVSEQSALFDEWLDIRNPLHKHSAPFTPELQDELEEFYLERYCMWFSQGLFGLATSQIPMVNMYDDHDVFDGYGSYPHHDMNSPVMCGLGSVAFKYYMLFQHQSVMTESENTEPSWIIGADPGPYIKEHSRSVFASMGGKVALLAVDCRTERTEHNVLDDKTWEQITNRLYSEVRLGQIDHLLVLLGVPIAYPRLVWLENILTSRLMTPVKALGKTGIFGKALNNIDGGVEVLDDLNDHWTAKNHKHERSIIIEDLQDLAMDKSVRITFLSGDVHLAAVGQFYSNPQLGLAKHNDPRYMPNIISSAMVNTPPSDLMADVLNKRNKVHHFDRHTDENMIPLFHHGVDGKPRNNKRLLPHRNWCSIRHWTPGQTPPPTPPLSVEDRSPSPPSTSGGGLFRRFSKGKSATNSVPQMSRESVRGARPPVSKAGFFRSLSRRGSTKAPNQPVLTRTMSLGSTEAPKRSFFGFGRRASESRPDDGGINGQWGPESDLDDEPADQYYQRQQQQHQQHQQHQRQQQQQPKQQQRPSGLRGGGLNDEYTEGDEAHFNPVPPRRAQTIGSLPPAESNRSEDPMIRPFHRTPTGLTIKQLKRPQNIEVDLEGGLDICLHVEVNRNDPTGITIPYRLLVPRLQYTYQPGDDELPKAQPTGFKRLLSFRKKQPERPATRSDEGRTARGRGGDDSEDGDSYMV